ncbi:metallophosphoesterase, partial [candidate division WOR-3 bacterium]|nr:metallophosphoesterase [candidate division WOR-3 bacterium]
MRIGIFSDVHGNLEALEAVLRRLKEEGAERYVCCGDIVGYGPDPNRCIEIVRALGCLCVAGNHDWAAAGRISAAGFSAFAAEAISWTREQLSEPCRGYLGGLSLTWEE